MRTKLIVLDVVLILALCMITRATHAGWNEAEARGPKIPGKELRATPLKEVFLPGQAAPAAKPAAAPATHYGGIVAGNLFSRDRNSGVAADPPKVEGPHRMPPLPVVYGVLELPSGIKAIMSEGPGSPARSVHAGETIGEYKIILLDARDVTFGWQGRQIFRKLEDLIGQTGLGADGRE